MMLVPLALAAAACAACWLLKLTADAAPNSATPKPRQTLPTSPTPISPPDDDALNQQQQQADTLFAQSSLALGSTVTCALVYPPLLLLHIPALLYLTIPRVQEAGADVFEKKKITVNVISTVSSVGTLTYAAFYPAVLTVYAASVWLYAMTQTLALSTQNQTRQNLTELFSGQPRRVWRVQDGVEIEVAIESIAAGDILAVDAGQIIPIDGIIQTGAASIDEQMLTGESKPAEKAAGDTVFAATLVLAGRIYVRTDKAGRETLAAQIGDILQNTSHYTASVQLQGQAVADHYAQSTLGLGVLALPIAGPGGMLAVLGSGVGNTMRILGPVSVLSFLQLASRRGILVKDGRALEHIRHIDTVVFDKTGTLTLRQPHVSAIHPCPGCDEDMLLAYAAAAEARQTHPIARAIVQAAAARGLELPSIGVAAYEVGYGIKVAIAGRTIRVGSDRFMAHEAISIPPATEAIARDAHAHGHSLIYVAIDSELAGVVELRPSLRPEAKGIIDRLHNRGIAVHILSGDHDKPTRMLAEQLGVGDYRAETLPEQKAEYIAELRQQGKFVCFIGDGINDSIALKTAHVSVAIGGTTSLATDTAQIILMSENIGQLDELFALAQRLETNLDRDLISSFIPGGLIIGGVFTGAVGLVSSVGLYWLGALAGLANAASPLLEETATNKTK